MAGPKIWRVQDCMLTALSIGGLTSLAAQADITLDGSLGLRGPLTGPDYEIPAAVGEQVGANLFQPIVCNSPKEARLPLQWAATN